MCRMQTDRITCRDDAPAVSFQEIVVDQTADLSSTIVKRRNLRSSRFAISKAPTIEAVLETAVELLLGANRIGYAIKCFK